MVGSSDQDRVRHPGILITLPSRLHTVHLRYVATLLPHLNPLTSFLRHFFPHVIVFSTLAGLHPVIIAQACMTTFSLLALKKSCLAILRPPVPPRLP